MTGPEAITSLQEFMGASITAIEVLDNRYFVELEGEDSHVQAVKHLTDKFNSRLMTISASDMPAYYELLYHMDMRDHVISFRTRIWKPALSISSVSGANPAAELVEHEITEMFGIAFEGNPRPTNMILDEETQKGLTPLRAKVTKLDARMDKNIATIVELGSTTEPSRRVMKARSTMGMPENPPLCGIKCPAKSITYEIAESTGTKSRHPGLNKREASE